MADALDPKFVTPLVAYLVSEECQLTHEIFDVGAGRYARIFVGMAPGWIAPKGRMPTIEDIRDNLEKIRSVEGYSIPSSIADETKAMAEALRKRA
jgi:hypothetical protein